MSYQDLNRVEIDLAAISFNLRAIKGLLGPGVGIIAVVKSDAYGHGMAEVAERLLSAGGVSALAVFDINEAARLRETGVGAPILLLSGAPPGDEEGCLELGLICGVHCRSMLDSLELKARKSGKTALVHLKIDTGMGRMGFAVEEFLDIVKGRGRWPHIEMSGLYSHLSSADEPDDPLNREQLEAFAFMLQRSRKMEWTPRVAHLANSAGIVHFKDAHFDAVRPGLAIYGAYPGGASMDRIKLEPAMSLKSKVISVRRLPAGTPVSYGHSFVTNRASDVAVVPIGYDDGYSRALSGRAEVLIRGRRLPVLGRICMKSMMVDVTDVPGVSPGEDVVLLGRQGDGEITIEELAVLAGTISYELLCLLGTRNKRYFIGM